MTDYQKRVLAQGELWIAGLSTHNVVDDECCADFSCCAPHLLEADMQKRIDIHNAWCRRNGFPEYDDIPF